MYVCSIMYIMCPTSCYHNGFMASPELNGYRMYSYTLLDCNFGVTRVLKLQAMSEAIYPYIVNTYFELSTQSREYMYICMYVLHGPEKESPKCHKPEKVGTLSLIINIYTRKLSHKILLPKNVYRSYLKQQIIETLLCPFKKKSWT